MRHVPLAPAILTLALLAAPALAAPAPNSNGGGNGPWGGNDGNNGRGNGRDGGGLTNLTTPGPEAAIGLPALLAAGAGAILYIRSRRRRAS